jgi:hypothetical protein
MASYKYLLPLLKYNLKKWRLKIFKTIKINNLVNLIFHITKRAKLNKSPNSKTTNKTKIKNK